MKNVNKTTNEIVVLESTYNEDGSIVAVATRRASKKEKKAGIVVDSTSPVATFKLAKPDEFKCSVLTIECHKNESEEFFKQAVQLINNAIDAEKIIFIRVDASEFGGKTEIQNAFTANKYVQDPSSKAFYEFEKPLTSYTALYTCIGSSLGIVFGMAVFDSILIMSVGIGLGFAIGGCLDVTHRSARDELKKKRGNSITKTTEE